MNILLSILLVCCGGIVDRRETTVIVIHHSATSSGNMEIFKKFHVEERGWEDIGYHFVITNGHGGADGLIQKGRPLQKQGAHAKNSPWGDMNPYSVGICLVGEDIFTEKQKIATVLLVANLCLKYNIDPSSENIRNHHQDCPGSGLDLKEIIQETKKFWDFFKKLQELNPTLQL
ncbi:peptidoglycan recognition protein family protein [Patescibacteria group bacterium]|nr:peptidoglycan recognition protein family protein [Patescibacteria group bacterium]